MNCITDQLKWFDWMAIIIIYTAGVWQLKRLIDIYAPKIANKIIAKIEGKHPEP